MKKLTAGIFTVLMGLVTVNAAEAAVASKGYVDEVAKAAAANVTALGATVSANKTAADEAIAAAQKASEDALAAYKETNDTAVAKNAEDIAKNAQAISTNAASISTNAAAIETEKSAREQADTALDTRLQEVEKFSGEGEGSVAKQIAEAIASEVSRADEAYDAAGSAAQALTDAKVYADDLAPNYDAAGSASKALESAEAYADKAIAEAIAATEEAAKIYIDATELEASQTAQNAAIEAAYTAADKVITDSIGEVDEGKTVVQMIEAAQAEATYDDEEVRGLIADNAEAIATKLTDTTKISEDGVYVLTAVTVGEDTTYAWELITRETAVQE